MVSYVEAGGSGGEDTGNRVCGRREENTGNEVCALSCEDACEDTGNGVCGRRERWAESLYTCAVLLRDWWHWKQGVSGLLSVALHSQRHLGVWSGNVGGASV